VDIEDWLEILDDDDIEYPLLCSMDNIWTPPENKN